ncbi:uncharacterized protein [Cicer arietinum]|uniref:Uncharacterized protein LOC113785763 n=1 Tax=Cicer arietinum TaxID=3827 RepID=A0A3Q7YDL8_CICAR|nr:uncharacterized protein LOC113785763 [Cicer arietinum]
MDELEQTEIREDVNHLKGKMTKILEILQALANRNDGNPLVDEGVPQNTLVHPMGVVSHIYTNYQEGKAQQFPPYGLPPGYTPPIDIHLPNNNTLVVATNPQHGTGEFPQVQPSPLTSGFPGSSLQGKSTEANPVMLNIHHEPRPLESNHSQEKWQALEERLRVVEGGNNYGFDASDLCLVFDVIIPPKFKLPEFEKYKGTACPKNHLIMYCRKMGFCAHDEKLLIHFFQDSLTRASLSWYMHLERAHISSWKDLVDAFLKQYKYNLDMAPDRIQLQNMTKRGNETFKEYAQRWRELASQVESPLSEKEMVTMFINTLQPPFYDKMIGSISSKISDLVIIGERVEMGLKSGKIASSYTGLNNTKKLSACANKKKEEEGHFVASNPANPSFVRHSYAAATPQITSTLSQHLQGNQDSYESQGKNYRGRKSVHFDPIPMTYAELLPHLVSNSMVALCPKKTIEPPYPKGYDSNSVCDYHSGAVGHSTENCLALKFKVHDLLKVGWLNFKENEPSVKNNPLPVHGGPIVNAIEENHQLIKEVEKIKAPMGLIFSELCKFGLIQGNADVKARCNFHLNEDHSIEECNEFKKELQKLINMGTIQIGRWEKDDGMIATQSEEKLGITIPKPLVIHFTKEESMNAPGDLRTLIVQIPSPFSYKDNKAVPWNYNVEVHLAKQKDKDVSSSKTTAVTNVSGIGMTRNDRICSPGKSQREMRVVFEKAYTDKEEKKVENEKVENEVSNEEAQEFLKIIKQSEYKIVDQLNHTPTRISLLSLLMNSESHRKLLMKILNEAHVTHDITVDKFGGIINNITTNNHLTFTDDELPTEGRGHNKALHISVMCIDHIISRVLIDNGSSLNVISKSTLAKLPCDGTYMRPSPMVVRAFDGSRREVMGEIDLPIQIGPVTFEITFHVMDIVPAYSCLLGRPWIHSAGVVPSTLHQKLKYMINDQLVIVSGEGDLLVSNFSTTPYVETTKDALETAFQTLEIVDTAYVETTPIEPHMSNTAIMVAKFMLSRGHHLWHGLGKDEEGLKEPVELPENRDKWGLGYKPTRDDKRKLVKEKKEKRLA